MDFLYYHPQTKFAKVMFLHMSVILSTRGEYLGRYPLGPGNPPGQGTPPGTRYPPRTRYTLRTRYDPHKLGTPWDQVHPPLEQCMPGDTGNKRVVRILLECILVMIYFLLICCPCGFSLQAILSDVTSGGSKGRMGRAHFSFQ